MDSIWNAPVTCLKGIGPKRAQLFAKLGARGAGKALVSLEALRELSLLEQRETPQGARWCLVPAAGKKDLASAPILRRLEAAQ